MRKIRLISLCVCAVFSLADYRLIALRFISLKSSNVNMRVGPGKEYPISWILMRSHLPLLLLSEFLHWRKVQLQDGTQGWVHQSTISYKNTAVVIQDTVLYKSDSKKKPIAVVENGVVVFCLAEREKFIKVRVNGMKGWIEIDKLWGVNQKTE